MADEYGQVRYQERETYHIAPDSERGKQENQSLEEKCCRNEELPNCELAPTPSDQVPDHDPQENEAHYDWVPAVTNYSYKFVQSNNGPVRAFPLVPKPAMQHHQQRQNASRCADDPEKDLPPLPLDLPNHKSRSVESFGPRLDEEHKIKSKDNMSRHTEHNQDDASIQDHSTFSILTTAEGLGPFQRRFMFLFQKLRYLYGDNMVDAVLNQELNEPTRSYPHGLTLFLILLSGALPYVVVVLDDTVVAIIIPILVNQFEKPADIGWYASAYFLPLTVLMPLCGKCYALWKVKWLFLSALIVIIVGSVISAAAQSSVMFITGRAIAGSGAAGIITGAMRIISLAAPRRQRTLLEAAGATVMGISTVSGPILGGVIADNIGWRWSFWINIPIAFISMSIILVLFPKEATRSTLVLLPLKEKLRRLDLIGASLLIAGLVCLSCTLQTLSTITELSKGGKALASLSGILLAVFLLHERFVDSHISLIPRKIIAVRTVWACSCGLFFLFAGFINFIFFLSIFFQAVRGQSPQSSAISLLPYVLSVSAAAATTGIAVSKVRYYNPFFILGGIFFATGAGLILTFDVNSSLQERVGYELLLGLGVGFLMLANVAPCHTVLDEEQHSIAQGLSFLCSLLGATISLPVSSTIFNRTLTGNIEPLQISTLLKVIILLDPTKVHAVVPAEDLPVVLSALVDSIRKTFLFGLCCSIACALFFYLVPWIPLIGFQETPEYLPETPPIFTSPEEMSDISIPDESPKLPPLSFLFDQSLESSLRSVCSSERNMTMSLSGVPISGFHVQPILSGTLRPFKRHSV